MNTKKSSVWEGALLLTAAALVVKLLSTVYRIPYQNMTGDFGFYVFQQAYPFYAIAVAIAFTGFPMALSRMIASEKNNTDHLIKTSVWTSFLLGILSFILLFATAPFLALLMGDSQLSLPIRVISVLFLFIPLSAFLRGTYQGYGDMQLTAVSQLLEQTFRVSGILFISFYLVRTGYSSYETGAGALAGSVLGAAASGLFLLFFWKKGITPPYLSKAKIRVSYAIELLKSSIYLSLSALVLALMQLVDAFLFVNVWVESGMQAYDAKLLKGIFDRGQPLLQLGTVAAASVALAVVPEMAHLVQEKRKTEIQALTKLSVKISVVFGGAAAVGLICIMEPLNTMLFKNAAGSSALAVLCLSIIPVSIIYTSTGLLQGIGHGRYAALSILAAIFVKVAGNLVWIPYLGMEGAAVSTVIATSVAAVIQLIKLQTATRFMKHVRAGNLFAYLFALGVMVAGVMLWIFIAENMFEGASRLDALFISVTSSVVGGMLYLIAIIKCNIFSKEEWDSVYDSVETIRKLVDRLKKRRRK
ncbi:putative polysaccharide biosynthesis protein [Fictibacillus phosphorivorans]|uniref:putative polysaccharide biosynthesis protein n=1 Tax=Fictibacillus phosphorivorans TaxID=1221500 RepID=UPI00203E2210|nr:polysaccharide biosynthesis protein [Fictibacillus phosphorivorans]MCM3719873.1 polysaccharide biosynthesis protein [Fictibacillus phosphorivorans]MCM3777563.1 polysaccharide biosynthesis protein [Fictibacillus phosphorivorans]